VAEIRLLELDPDLAKGIPEKARAVAARLVTASSLVLDPGPWDPSELLGHQDVAGGMLVMEGVLARDVIVAGRRSRQLLGPGYPVPYEEGGDGALLPTMVAWTVIQRSEIALLGRRWIAAVGRWPQLAIALQGRANTLVERLATHQAISQLPRVEDRLLAVLLHLAEDWGRMTSEGVVVQLGLTHKELGQLIGARRPTVSLALATLAAAGAVLRQGEDWLLDPAAAAAWSEEVDELAAVRRGPRRATQGSTRSSRAESSTTGSRTWLAEHLERVERNRKEYMVALERTPELHRRTSELRATSQQLRLEAERLRKPTGAGT
jgi:hypothetical protein